MNSSLEQVREIRAKCDQLDNEACEYLTKEPVLWKKIFPEMWEHMIKKWLQTATFSYFFAALDETNKKAFQQELKFSSNVYETLHKIQVNMCLPSIHDLESQWTDMPRIIDIYRKRASWEHFLVTIPVQDFDMLWKTFGGN